MGIQCQEKGSVWGPPCWEEVDPCGLEPGVPSHKCVTQGAWNCDKNRSYDVHVSVWVCMSVCGYMSVCRCGYVAFLTLGIFAEREGETDSVCAEILYSSCMPSLQKQLQ